MTDDAVHAWEAIRPLAEPTRRRVYEALCGLDRPSTRDEVAGRVGIGRQLAAFHLDALASAGLVEVDYARPPGRGGPGAGRPAKRYRPRHPDVLASTPPRRYELAATILAAGVASAAGGDVRTAIDAAAESTGSRLGAELATTAASPPAAVCDLLARIGYQPELLSGQVVLRNCPFHAAVETARELVCGMNLALVRGAIGGAGIDGLDAVLDPQPGQCCVQVRTRT
jgi:predicted ArsR family transcriptional regulator